MSFAASSSDEAGGPKVIYTTEFLNLELKDLIRNALVACRLLLGGTLFEYLKLDLATKKEGDALNFTGIIEVKPQNFKRLAIPASRGIPKPPEDAKSKRVFQLAYVYTVALIDAFKLLVLVSHTIRAPERRHFNTNPYLSLKEIYGRLSTDIELSKHLRESCGAFIPADNFKTNFAAILDILTSVKGREVDMRRSKYTPEEITTRLLKWKAVFTKVLFLAEDIVPPLEEFGIVTTKKKTVDRPIPANDLRYFLVSFKSAIDKWEYARWAEIYQRDDLFNPYFLFFPMPRDNEGNVDVFTEDVEEIVMTPAAPNPSPFNEKNLVLAVMDGDKWVSIVKFLILIFVRVYATQFFGSTEVALGRLEALRKELNHEYRPLIVNTNHVAYFNAINKHLNRANLPQHLVPLFNQRSKMYIFSDTIAKAITTAALHELRGNKLVFNRHLFIRRFLVAISALNRPPITPGSPILSNENILMQGYANLQTTSDARMNEFLRFNYPPDNLTFDLDLKPRLLKNTN